MSTQNTTNTMNIYSVRLPELNARRYRYAGILRGAAIPARRDFQNQHLLSRAKNILQNKANLKTLINLFNKRVYNKFHPERNT